MTQRLSPAGTALSRRFNVGLWIVQGLLALAFATTGGSKIVGTQQTVQLFEHIGVGQWFRYVVGVLEIAGAIGLLIPRLSGLAAAGLTGVMAGAVVTEVFIVHGS